MLLERHQHSSHRPLPDSGLQGFGRLVFRVGRVARGEGGPDDPLRRGHRRGLGPGNEVREFTRHRLARPRIQIRPGEKRFRRVRRVGGRRRGFWSTHRRRSLRFGGRCKLLEHPAYVAGIFCRHDHDLHLIRRQERRESVEHGRIHGDVFLRRIRRLRGRQGELFRLGTFTFYRGRRPRRPRRSDVQRRQQAPHRFTSQVGQDQGSPSLGSPLRGVDVLRRHVWHPLHVDELYEETHLSSNLDEAREGHRRKIGAIQMQGRRIQRIGVPLLHGLRYGHQAALPLPRSRVLRGGRPDLFFIGNFPVLRAVHGPRVRDLRHRRSLRPLRAVPPLRRGPRTPRRPFAPPPRRPVRDLCRFRDLRPRRRRRGPRRHGTDDHLADGDPPRSHGQRPELAAAHARPHGGALGRQRL
mmetsp:Transcript_7746/g.25436  ORF Transcript_7746/g.25436 Transcript_7746/m.25436 type:complete len:410 (+) Transcript_7746:680-1909(+)